MFKGGYKLIDFKNKSIAVNGGTTTIDGVFESIEANHRKPTIITGLVLDGVERSDRYINFRVTNGNYCGVIGLNDEYVHLIVTITPENTVSVAEM